MTVSPAELFTQSSIERERKNTPRLLWNILSSRRQDWLEEMSEWCLVRSDASAAGGVFWSPVEEPRVQQCCQLRPQAVSKSRLFEGSFCSAWEVKWEVISLKKPPSEDLLIKKREKKTAGSCNLLELLQGVSLWKVGGREKKRTQIHHPDGKYPENLQ